MTRLRSLARLALELAVPLVAIAAAVVAYRLGAMAVLERLLPRHGELLTPLRRIGVVASALGAYWAVARFYERRSPRELAFRPLATAASAVAGVALIGAALVTLRALDAYRVLSFRELSPALPIAGTIVLAVALEETIFRGVIYRILERDAGTVVALPVQAVAFGALHAFNEGAAAATVVSVTLLGALWTLVYVRWRNLWMVVAHHAAWNVTIFAAGAPLSGQAAWRLKAPLESNLTGPAWLTGAAFGPEDSVVTIAAVAGAAAALAVSARARGTLVAGGWRQGSNVSSGTATDGATSG